MGFEINRDAMEDEEFAKETKYIPAGINQARLVSYIELGMHMPMFKGKPAMYSSESKKAGQTKPAEFIIHLVFEFPRAEHTGDFPLCIRTSVPYGSGEFINKLSVSEALMSGNISMAYANRSKFMKYLNAMNDSCGTSYDGLEFFVGEPFLIAVTNKPGTKARDDGTLPIYANMKPEGINSIKYIDQMDQTEKEAKVPEQIGDYCSKFFWDTPTEEAWKEVPKYLKECMKKAVDYNGSALQVMLSGMPEEEDIGSEEPKDNKGRPAESDDLDDIPF